MKKIVLFVGDCDESVAKTAKKFDSSAFLIDHNNYKKFLTSSSDGYTAYTSLADLPKQPKILYDLLLSADLVYYCPPKTWSDQKIVDREDLTNSMQGLTEFYLCAVNKIKNHVVEFNFSKYFSDKYLKLVDNRKSLNPQLWIAGCSTTAGVGVEKNQTYGHVLSEYLSLPVSVLATPASSISWAADQILRSDIRENDIVVWGLTQENRLTVWDENNNCASHVTSGSSEKSYADLPATTVNRLLVHKTNFFIAIQRILEVVNFCQKIKAKLLIFNIHSSNLLSMHLCNVNEFFIYIHKSYNLADYGTDNLHAGPLQHKLYADFCYQQLKTLKYI